MARPLLRRPWERLALGVCAKGSVALGYVGERGGLAQDDTRGCVLAFAGEIHGPPRVRTGDACARELLSLYLKDGAKMSPPEGCFTMAIWDGRAGDLVLLTDRFADQGLYVGREGKVILAAGELKGLVAGGFAARLDVQGIAESLPMALRSRIIRSSPGFDLVPDATTLVFGAIIEASAGGDTPRVLRTKNAVASMNVSSRGVRSPPRSRRRADRRRGTASP